MRTAAAVLRRLESKGAPLEGQNKLLALLLDGAGTIPELRKRLAGTLNRRGGTPNVPSIDKANAQKQMDALISRGLVELAQDTRPRVYQLTREGHAIANTLLEAAQGPKDEKGGRTRRRRGVGSLMLTHASGVGELLRLSSEAGGPETLREALRLYDLARRSRGVEAVRTELEAALASARPPDAEQLPTQMSRSLREPGSEEPHPASVDNADVSYWEEMLRQLKWTGALGARHLLKDSEDRLAAATIVCFACFHMRPAHDSTGLLLLAEEFLKHGKRLWDRLRSESNLDPVLLAAQEEVLAARIKLSALSLLSKDPEETIPSCPHPTDVALGLAEHFDLNLCLPDEESGSSRPSSREAAKLS